MTKVFIRWHIARNVAYSC